MLHSDFFTNFDRLVCLKSPKEFTMGHDNQNVLQLITSYDVSYLLLHIVFNYLNGKGAHILDISITHQFAHLIVSK